MYLGAPAAAPRSMKSKSRTRFSAARPTTNRLKAIPIGLRVVDERDALAEEPHDHRHEIQEADGAGRGHDAELEVLARPDEARRIHGEQHGQGAEGEAHRVDDDAGVALLEEQREAAQEKALEGGVERRRVGRGRVLEDGDEGGDESADETDAG